MLEVGKTYKTTNGDTVEIIYKLDGNYPYVGVNRYNGANVLIKYSKKGLALSSTSYDLIVTKTIDMWVNVYPSKSWVHPNKEEALRHRVSNCLGTIHLIKDFPIGHIDEQDQLC